MILEQRLNDPTSRRQAALEQRKKLAQENYQNAIEQIRYAHKNNGTKKGDQYAHSAYNYAATAQNHANHLNDTKLYKKIEAINGWLERHYTHVIKSSRKSIL